MAYTAVKLADVQKAIAAVTAANKKYTDAQASSKTSQTALNTAKKTLETAQSKLASLQSDFDNQKYLTTNAGYKTANTALAAAEKKLNDARSFLDSGQYLDKNAAYQNSLKAIATAEKNRDAAQSRLDAATDRNRASLERALTTANKAVDTAYANADRSRAAAEKLAQTAITTAEKAFDTSNANLEKARVAAEKAAYAPIVAQQKLVDTNQVTFDKAQEKYQTLIDSFQPLLDQRNEAINGVTEYLNTFRDSLGEVTKKADATAANTLLTQIGAAVKNSGITDLQKSYADLTKGWDVMKMAAIPTVNLKDGNPDVFSNIDPTTKLPILDQGGLDGVFDRYKKNIIDTQQYRDNWNKFGWNAKSDASTALRGAAILGLDKGTIQEGMSGGRAGIVKAGTSQEATDADFKKAADNLKIDYNSYIRPIKFEPSVGGMGFTERATAQNSREYTDPNTGESYLARVSGGKFVTKLDKEALYNTIQDQTKDFYMVANTVDGGNKHASLLFKADGSGNLIPVVDDKGNPQATYYSATRNVTGQNWYDDLLPVAAIAAAVFAPQAIGAISGAMGGSAAATVAAGAVYNASTAALLGGDPLKAGVMGAAGAAASLKATEIANASVGAENVAKLAEFAKVTIPQAEKAIATGVTTGLTSAALDRDNVLANTAAAVAGQLGSAQAKNVVQDMLAASPSMNTAVSVASNVAEVAAQTVVRMGAGQDVDLASALQNSMPSIIGEAVAITAQTATTPIVEKSFTGDTDIATSALKPFYPQFGQATAALEGSTLSGKTVTDVGFGGEGTDEPLFPGAGASIGANQKVGPIRTVTTDQGERYQARDITYQNGTRATILYDPANDTYKQIVTYEPPPAAGDIRTLAPMDVTAGPVGPATLEETKSDVLSTITQGKVAEPEAPTAPKPVTPEVTTAPIKVPMTPAGGVPVTGAPGAASAAGAPTAGISLADAISQSGAAGAGAVPGTGVKLTGATTPGTGTAPGTSTAPSTSTSPGGVTGGEGTADTTTPDKTLPPVEVIGEPEDELDVDTTKASQEFPLTEPEQPEPEAGATTGAMTPRQQMLDFYATLTSQPTVEKPTTKWFDRFLGTTLPTPGYKSIFDPTEYEFLDTELPEQVEFMEPVSPPPTPDQTTPQSPLSQATTLSSNPQAYAMQGASTVPSSYYQYGDLNALNLGSNLLTPATGTPYARGGLASMRPTAALFAARGGEVPHKGSHYVQGAGGGQDDLIDAKLADGEYVFDADIVAALGDGSNAEGARRLDKMREAIRKHKRGAPNDKIPPKAKSPLAYFKGAK